MLSSPFLLRLHQLASKEAYPLGAFRPSFYEWDCKDEGQHSPASAIKPGVKSHWTFALSASYSKETHQAGQTHGSEKEQLARSLAFPLPARKNPRVQLPQALELRKWEAAHSGPQPLDRGQRGCMAVCMFAIRVQVLWAGSRAIPLTGKL